MMFVDFAFTTVDIFCVCVLLCSIHAAVCLFNPSQITSPVASCFGASRSYCS